jgi:hypothetical protein
VQTPLKALGGAVICAVITGFGYGNPQVAQAAVVAPHQGIERGRVQTAAQRALLAHDRAGTLRSSGSGAQNDRRGSWMLPAAKGTANLLYVADEATNAVDVFSYPKGAPMGQLTGFDTPSGICSDKAGEVYILNGNGTTAVVYAHGGTEPLRTLSLGGFPELNCTVDPTTNNFAVGVIPENGASGYIAVFANGEGTPTTYTPSGELGLPGCAYDASGNLFCDAIPSSGGGFNLYELPAGSSTVQQLNVSGSLGIGSMQWDGKYVALSSGVSGTIAQLQITGSTATVANTTTLANSGTIWQFWIPKVPKPKKQSQAARILAPTSFNSSAFVGYWKYPAGGMPTKSITGFTQPDGVAVSTLK